MTPKGDRSARRPKSVWTTEADCGTDKFEFYGLHDWQVGRLFAALSTWTFSTMRLMLFRDGRYPRYAFPVLAEVKDFASVDATLTSRVDQAGTVAQQATCLCEFTREIHGRDSMTGCKRHDLIATTNKEWIVAPR
jgi:hypothetical protein